jgi:GH18 family chitinase
MRWPFRCGLPKLLLLVASASALSPLDQIEQNALPCPSACQDRGPSDWSLISSPKRLAVCPEPLLLVFGLNTAFQDGKTNNPVYACTLGNANTKTNFLADQGFVDPDAMGKTNFDPVRRRAVRDNTTCSGGVSKKLETRIAISAWDSEHAPISNDPGADTVMATKQLVAYLERSQSDCGKTIMFTYYRGTLVGLYSGSQFDGRKTLESLSSTLIDAVKGEPNSRYAIEACQGRRESGVFGLVADPTGDFAAVQATVKSWNEGNCVTGSKDSKISNIQKAFAWGYSQTPNVRASRMAKVSADGTCASYTTVTGDICDMIAAAHGVSVDDLEKWNKKTWAWDGCDNLKPFVRICVSAGNPPMPASVWNAECGPTRNDTEPPGEGEDLSSLNPCPLNVCCNRWGMCGLTDDFCRKSSSGNPGTGELGEAGCISNCERTLTNNNKAPAKFRKIGYFEAWNYDRPCLHMHVLDIDKSYSHIHFSFAEISQNLNVVIPENVKEQFQSFIKSTDIQAKKIIAFGGWAFSNEGSGTGLFRKAVSPGNRQAFANRVVQFAIQNNLDGVDFDWEYPGATDIDGSDPGQKDDGENYYQFLKLVREKLPKDKSLSIAAPASFWYLKGFPIKQMAGVLDYIIYMTYDLHGQWDVGSKWASPGCPAGNCLRSHVNSTETMDALIMVTRAGVESHKVVVGVSSYGRSFKMSSSTCRGPQCTFLGGRNDSKAKKGRCTDTAGYISDFEINEIISKGGAIKKWYDEATDSDYLVYEGDEWVAYMSKVTKSRRMRDYMKLNFGGTTDWAIDLQDDHDKRYTSGRPVFLDPKVWETPSATCEAPCILVFPPSKLPETTTININKYTTSLEYGATGKTTISGKETTAFVTKTTTITVDVPAFVTNSMMYSNINVTQGQKLTDLVVQPSVKLPNIPVRVPDGEGSTTTRTLTLPPWPFSAQSSGASGSTNHTRPSTTSSFNWGEVITQPEVVVEPTETHETISGLPVYTKWPEFKIEPIKEEIKEPTPDDDGFKTPCELWFFQLCFPGFKSLKWKIGPGILPPGPPPPGPIFLTNLPVPAVTHPTPYPPWPPITVGLDHKPTYSEKPECETETASICWTTTTLSPTVIGPVTSTVTKSESECNTIYGCSVTDKDNEFTKTKTCSRPTSAPNRHVARELEKKQADPIPHSGCYPDAIVLPIDLYQDGAPLSSMLDADGKHYKEITTRNADDTKDLYVYWWIPNMDPSTASKIESQRYGFFKLDLITPLAELQDGSKVNSKNITEDTRHLFMRQDLDVPRWTESWAPSQITLPKGGVWRQSPLYPIESLPELGSGQYVYVVAESGIDTTHHEFTGVDIEFLDVPIHQDVPYKKQLNLAHGNGMSAMAVGVTMGLSPKSTLVMANIPFPGVRVSAYLSAWAAILRDIVRKNRKGISVISVSTVLQSTTAQEYVNLLKQLIIEIGKTDTVIATCASNNEVGDRFEIDTYPPSFGDELTEMIVVGATNQQGFVSTVSRDSLFIDVVFAPGESVPVPDGVASGTSLSAPLVAGLVAYLRSLPYEPYQDQLKKPATVKKLIKGLSRSFAVWDDQTQETIPPQVGQALVVWNGHVGTESCLMGKSPPPEGCPELPPNLNDIPDYPGSLTPNDPASPGGPGKTIKWEPGTDGPKCSANSLVRRLFERAEATCGGQLCSGYYCRPNPPGPPPDFRDPKDPNRYGNGPQGEIKPPNNRTMSKP